MHEDLWPVLDLTFDSAPTTRARVFRALIERGTLNTSDVVKLLRCSAPTARKEMEALAVLGVAEKTTIPDKAGMPEHQITLDTRFEWFTSPECQALLKDEHTPSVTAEAGKDERDETHTPCKSFQLADVADERAADGQLKENASCVCADEPVSTSDAATNAGHGHGHAHSLLADLVDGQTKTARPSGRRFATSPAEILFGESPHRTSAGIFHSRSRHRGSPLPGCQTQFGVIPDVSGTLSRSRPRAMRFAASHKRKGLFYRLEQAVISLSPNRSFEYPSVPALHCKNLSAR